MHDTGLDLPPELVVTNFNRNFTGVSATAAGVVRHQARTYRLILAGHPLPAAPDPVAPREALRLSRHAPAGRDFIIWHVRRNTEMRTALWARDVLRLPVRIVFTSAAQRRHSAWPRWLISRMDAVIATTELAAGFVPHVRAVVPHGVDTELFTPAPDPATAWRDTGFPGTHGIATVGRIRPEKGTDRFVEVMLRLLPKVPGLTALVIGRGERRDPGFAERLKARVAAAGLADRILFPGEITPDELRPVLRALTLLVQLPRYEGYGMVPLEGMACAVPFVSTDVGSFRAFSSDGRCGLVLQNTDPAAVAEHLHALLSDPAQRDAMASAARSTAEARFSVKSEAEAINSVYETLWAEG